MSDQPDWTQDRRAKSPQSAYSTRHWYSTSEGRAACDKGDEVVVLQAALRDSPFSRICSSALVDDDILQYYSVVALLLSIGIEIMGAFSWLAGSDWLAACAFVAGWLVIVGTVFPFGAISSPNQNCMRGSFAHAPAKFHWGCCLLRNVHDDVIIREQLSFSGHASEVAGGQSNPIPDGPYSPKSGARTRVDGVDLSLASAVMSLICFIIGGRLMGG